MKTKRYTSLILVAALTLAPLAQADIADEAAGGAAASLGILLGTEAYKALSTRSAISVVVEQYQDTQQLYNSLQTNQPVEERRTVPFRLGKPAAIAKLKDGTAQQFTFVAAVRIRNEAAPYMEQIKASQAAVAANPVPAGLAEPKKAVGTITAISNDVLAAWNAYAKHVDGLVGKGGATEAELNQARTLLETLRDQLKRLAEHKLPKSLTDFVVALMGTALAESVNSATLLPKLGPLQSALDKATTMSAQGKVMNEFFDDLPEADQKIAQSMGIASHGLGFAISFQAGDDARKRTALLALKSMEMALSATAALSVTYLNVGTSMNFGPIKNEVTQVLLTGNAQLDEILDHADDPTRWRMMNFAKSKGGLGNHTAVIYLDNTATPVLKEASFDPSGFIEAYGMVYETAMDSALGVFGLPDSLPEGGDTNNLYRLNQSSNTAKAGARQYVNDLAAAATKLKAQYDDLGTAAQTPADAKTAISALATSLAGPSN